jgi:phenylalanyl-tRNA synthetase beta chain
VAPGQKVPCALVGAKLPGLEIRKAKLRGVESSGMLCSARELGLSDDHAGLLVLEPSAQIGADVRRLLALDDTYFTLKLTPNRGDCLSMLGIARDVAAITGAKLVCPSRRRSVPRRGRRVPCASPRRTPAASTSAA